jgi:prevent-host-death family protein
MRNLQVRPVRDLRNKYSEIESLLENHDPVIITKNGRGAAVLLNIDDYAEIEEYQHIRYVAEKLQEAEAEEKSDKPDWIEYKTLFRKMKKKYHGL